MLPQGCGFCYLQLTLSELFYFLADFSNILLGDSVEDARHLEAKIQLQCELQQSSICLTVEEWRVMYESVNAVIYGLGPSELHTYTRHNLQEVCSINLKICAILWGAYGVGRSWVGSERV